MYLNRTCRSLFGALLLLWLVVHSSIVLAGTVQARSMQSAALATEFRYTVYLPDGYESGQLRYPVLYLLHGHGGNETDWLVQGGLQSTVDKLIREGTVLPFLVVMPGGANSWWINGAKDRVEDALIQELIPYVDATYRTIASRGGRMIAGLSAGGFGTVNAVLKYPEMFAAGAALSPAIYNPMPPAHSSTMQVAAFQKDGQFDPLLWSRLNYTGSMDAYQGKKVVVPMYIHSGDHDSLFIAYHAAVFFQRLFEYQPRMVELRIVDGDHEWPVWREGIGDAIRYMIRFVSPPQGNKP
jgi:enterochelin esterase-like enzyme